MKNILTIVLILIIFSSAFSQKEKKHIISSEGLMETVKELSSVKYGGRLAGSEGYNKAAEYIAGVFKKLGLGHFEKNYFQKFNVEYNDITYASYKMINKQGKVKNYTLGKDFVCRGFTGSGKVTGNVVFCGYGTSNGTSYDDFTNIDVKNKIVMIFKPSPKWGAGWVYNDPREKTNYAILKGAKAVIFVSLPNDPKPQKPIGSTISGKGEQNEKVPQLHIDITAANELLSGTGYTLSRLQTIIDSTQKPLCIDLINKVSINVKAKYEEKKPTMNIIGRIKGYDPDYADEYMVIGAHLDHVGMQGNLLFPGANDNASGAAAVLEIAKAIMRNKISPKYSILFVLFSDEEHGMDGSKYFVGNPVVPLNKIKYMLNLDCIGYGDSIQIGGGKSNPELWNKIKSIDLNNAKLMVNATWPGGGADAQAFFDAGIKTAYFVSTNSYEYLHMPGDKPETLNKRLFQSIAELAYLTLIDISEAGQSIICYFEGMPSFPGGQNEMVSFLNSNLVYPEAAYNSDIEGKVFVQFVVSRMGEIENLKIQRGINPECDKEAINMIKSMPIWIPGTDLASREAKDIQVCFPINFNKSTYDNLPKYPGGRDEMYKFINGKLNLLSIDCNSKKDRTAYVKFSIDSSGQLCNVSILQGINKYYDDMVIRVIKMMPKWIPGKIDNKNVTQDVIIPVTFDEVGKERFTKKGEKVFEYRYCSMPIFPGGDDSLRSYFAKNIKWPEVNGTEVDCEGRVYVTFQIDKKGKMKDISISKSLSPEFDKEVLRVINLMPDWIPTKPEVPLLNDIVTIPVSFKKWTSYSTTEDSCLIDYKNLRSDIEEPQFPGGECEMKAFIRANLSYYELRQNSQMDIEGNVYAEFIVTKDGTIQNISILNDIGGGTGEAAINVIKKMPKWIPAKHYSKNMDRKVKIKIQFQR